MRTCVGCRRRDSQSNLLRVVRTSSGRLQADVRHCMPGRGAWLHPDRACLASALRRGGFSRSFRGEADASGLEDQIMFDAPAVSVGNNAREQPESRSDT
ncbi:YlxR family protein [Acaricomes phytoseiuli]|uniref:YlxR family protein n=1 Tax=Acaricomes phytoseiuli TaxID=291968 RepID=UPI000A053161|nr:YlxR family protein [Acaricomes phytoseiuli]MCW1249828.1 YlxR family protein [Acaricomes phytoseiuli]